MPRTAVPRVLAVLAVLAVLTAPLVWLQRVDPDPAVGSVSVWHCRPGAGNPSGGEWTDQERDALGDACRAAASTRFWAGATLLGLGVALGAAAVAFPSAPGRWDGRCRAHAPGIRRRMTAEAAPAAETVR